MKLLAALKRTHKKLKVSFIKSIDRFNGVEEETFETNWDLEVDKFDDMGLKEEILRGIYAYGYKEPTPIQKKGILPVIQGKDTIAQVRSQKGRVKIFTANY